MAGKRKKIKKRAESCRIPKETQVNLQRSTSDLATRCVDINSQDAVYTSLEPADFVKDIVLQKYAKPEHVSVVYVSNEPNLDEKRHAEALLREIARSIDCTIDDLENSMGAADSKQDKPKDGINEFDIDVYKRKSNLKPPKCDVEAYSDDDRSDCGKKRVTFQKHIVFDDGEQQTDDDVSFESLTSGEEDDYLDDVPIPDDEIANGDNKTVINIENGDIKRIGHDNSDSGFVEIESQVDSFDDASEVKSCDFTEVKSEGSESDTEVEEEEIIEEISIAEVNVITPEDPRHCDNRKTLVSQESKFQSQVAALTELADTRCGETEKATELISAYRKEIESKDLEIEQLKCELAAAYKESELIRQRSRSLEEELSAARSCSADLAEQLQRKNDESVRQLRAELEDAITRRAELESRVLSLERDRDRLEQEKVIQEQKAQEAITAAEANTAKWRAAHEAARSQAAARAERMLADCEWKMRELEKKARDADKQNRELTQSVEDLKKNPQPSSAHVAELQQLRGLVSEQQRSVQSLTLQLQRVETREEALKLEVHRLKELLERECRIGKEKEERHMQTIEKLNQQHSKTVQTMKAEHAATTASTRAAIERANAERTRAALAQLREEAEKDMRSADRKLREVTTRFENLKEELSNKESQFERAIAEANSKADWDILQLRHLLDKADINYANKIENMNEKFEQEKESIISEWTEKVRFIEEEAKSSAEESRKLLEATRLKLIAEKTEQISKLKEQHRNEMDDQWEQFMVDKENCLSRMKMECRQEGEEDRVKREKELLEEIAELKSQMQSKSVDFDSLAVKAAACGRTLAVTEQELKEALARERELRNKGAEDSVKMKQIERASKDQVEHLTRKCACLRKLFDDIRARLTAKERAAEQEARSRDKELHQLRAEVARLTKILVEESSPKLGARTKADGCETLFGNESLISKTPMACETPTPPRRKGGTLQTPEFARKRLILPELQPTPTAVQIQNGRRRAKSVDLPAVQVPVRIKQLEDKNKE